MLLRVPNKSNESLDCSSLLSNTFTITYQITLTGRASNSIQPEPNVISMEPTHFRAKAPLRIGLVGGGTDVNPYVSERGGEVFNTTIGKYAYCTITPTHDNTMSVHSVDYGKYDAPLDGGPLPLDGNMDLIKVVTNHFEIRDGFRMFLQSDAPPGSGLGGSSSIIVSIIAAVCQWRNIRMTAKEMAELAFKLERKDLGLKGGMQDQYTAVYGGFNVMKFRFNGVDINRVRVDDDVVNELEYRSVLCYTGTSRNSAEVIDSQIKKLESGLNVSALDATKALVGPMSDALSKGDINLAGEILDESWCLKK